MLNGDRLLLLGFIHYVQLLWNENSHFQPTLSSGVTWPSTLLRVHNFMQTDWADFCCRLWSNFFQLVQNIRRYFENTYRNRCFSFCLKFQYGFSWWCLATTRWMQVAAEPLAGDRLPSNIACIQPSSLTRPPLLFLCYLSNVGKTQNSDLHPFLFAR